MKKFILLITIMFFYANLFAQGQIINVPTDQPTIQAAINASVDGDTVLVADGTYYENINFRGKAITVASHFLIDGDETHIDSTIINGSQPTHPDSGSVVTFNSGEDTTSVLHGFTITGGKGTKDPYGFGSFGGGGIAVSYAGAKIQYNKVIYNSITHTTAVGGGIVISSNSNSILVLDNEISHNKLIETGGNPKGGGGIFCYEAQEDFILIANNFISDNVVSKTNASLIGSGGGIDLEKSNAVIRNNLIKNNKAQFGGGIGLIENPLTAKPIIVNNTIVKNAASVKDGGIYNLGMSVKIINSIVWGNTDPNSKQVTENLIVEYSDVEGGFLGHGNIDLDPQFADTVKYYLSPTSPCIDAGFPLTMYYDMEDPLNPGFPLVPALGNMRNDMGYCGGNSNMTKTELPEFINPLKVDMDNDGVPDRKGEFITTSGVVTSINFQKSSSNLGFYIYDWDSGIYVFADNDDSTNFELGDWIEVHGTIDQYSGLTEIVVDNSSRNLVLLEHDHALISKSMYIDELLKNPEKYEGMFVRINALKRNSGSWPTSNTSTNFNVTDGYKTLALRLDDDTDLGSNSEPEYPMDIKGVFSQYSNSQPANDGYQLLVNSYSDIEQNVEAEPSPYFFFTPESKANENSDYGIGGYLNYTVSLEWYPAVDLNEDNLTYEIVVIRNDGVIVEENPSDLGGTRPRTSKTNAQLIDFVQKHGENNSFTGSWVIRVTDGNTGMVASVDTLKNFTLNDLVSNVEDENTLPTKFALSQNYPNPFNPSTTIKYQIPDQVRNDNANVILKVYDILGKELVTLVNQKQKAGYYETQFDASSLTSGVYFYKLTAGDFVETKKMILLR